VRAEVGWVVLRFYLGPGHTSDGWTVVGKRGLPCVLNLGLNGLDAVKVLSGHFVYVGRHAVPLHQVLISGPIPRLHVPGVEGHAQCEALAWEDLPPCEVTGAGSARWIAQLAVGPWRALICRFLGELHGGVAPLLIIAHHVQQAHGGGSVACQSSQ
jgi:hypothetical protein